MKYLILKSTTFEIKEFQYILNAMSLGKDENLTLDQLIKQNDQLVELVNEIRKENTKILQLQEQFCNQDAKIFELQALFSSRTEIIFMIPTIFIICKCVYDAFY